MLIVLGRLKQKGCHTKLGVSKQNVLATFLVVVMKFPDNSSWRKAEFILAQSSQTQSIMEGRSWHQGYSMQEA